MQFEASAHLLVGLRVQVTSALDVVDLDHSDVGVLISAGRLRPQRRKIQSFEGLSPAARQLFERPAIELFVQPTDTVSPFGQLLIAWGKVRVVSAAPADGVLKVLQVHLFGGTANELEGTYLASQSGNDLL